TRLRILENKPAVLAEQVVYRKSERLYVLKITELQTTAQRTSRWTFFVAHRCQGFLLIFRLSLSFCIRFIFQFSSRVNIEKALVMDLGNLVLPFGMEIVFCQ